MLSPSSVRAAGRATVRPHRRLPWLTRGPAAMLAVSVLVLVGGLVATAAAAPCTAAAATSTTTPPLPLPLPTVSSCTPGLPLPVCQLPTGTAPPASGGPTTSAAPCTGVGCIPQPPTSAPPPSGTGTGQGGDGGGGSADCGVFSLGGCITNAINGFFSGVVIDALNPLLDLLLQTLLTTPTPDSLPQIGVLWNSSWQILLISYGLLVLIAGIIVMGYETVHSRHSIKEIGPRIVFGFLAGALSLWVATQGIQVANALSQAVMGGGVNASTAADTLKNMILNSTHDGGIFIIFIGLALAGVLVALLITYIVRVALTILLVVGAPLALMFHALPQTEDIAVWWWKSYGACLAIEVGQSLTLITATKVFLAPGGFTVFGPTTSGLINLLVALALIYILFKIPFWFLHAARGGGKGRSLVGSLVRGFLAYKTFGLLGGRPGGGRSRPAKGGGQGGRGGGSNPYAHTRTTSSGQYLLPLTGLRRGKPPQPPHQRYPARGTTGSFGPRSAPGGTQLSLPLSDNWPENKPVLDAMANTGSRSPSSVSAHPKAVHRRHRELVGGPGGPASRCSCRPTPTAVTGPPGPGSTRCRWTACGASRNRHPPHRRRLHRLRAGPADAAAVRPLPGQPPDPVGPVPAAVRGHTPRSAADTTTRPADTTDSRSKAGRAAVAAATGPAQTQPPHTTIHAAAVSSGRDTVTSSPIRIPADVDMADKVIGPLTARQLAILTVTGLGLYAVWAATRAFLPVPVFLALALPVGASAAMLALGQRDGLSLDRIVAAAIRQRMGARHRVAAPEGVRPAPAWLTAQTIAPSAGRAAKTGRRVEQETVSPTALRLPAEAVTDTGVVDLGSDGLAVVAVASTVNFALRTPAEQEALVASFGRYLHSLTAPIQVLVRTERLDLSGQIAELRERAGGLPHPALEAAAFEHADYLVQLGEQTDLLRRQVLLVLREPTRASAPTDGLGGPSPWAVFAALTRGTRRANGDGRADAATRRTAESRLVRRLGEAIELLAPAGIVVTPLDAGQATGVLASACNPDTFLPPSAGLAGADEVITTTGGNDLTDTPDREFWTTASPRSYAATTTHASDADDTDGDWDDGDEDSDFDDEGGRS